MLMKEHMKVLDQDLRNVAVVLHNITGQDELERIMENREKEVERETTITRKDNTTGKKTGAAGPGRQSTDDGGPDYG
jgi:hypothetical protein